MERKKAAKLLLEEEEAKIGGKTKSPPSKVTRAQISAAAEKQRQESEGATALPRGVVVEEPELMRNPNHLLRERMERGEVEARTVEEAIDVLSVAQEKGDLHPEKRQKAAYAAFEEREMPRLKAENPNLRQSQIKQMLRKDWMKSPENPLNHM